MKNKNEKKAAGYMRLKALGYALIYMVLAGLWILFSGAVLDQIVSAGALREQLEVYKGLLFVLFTGLSLYVLLRAWLRERPESESALPLEKGATGVKEKIQLPVVYAIALIVILASGSYVFFEHLKKTELKKIEQNLSATASLKMGQIDSWLRESAHFAAAVGQRSYLARAFGEWVATGKLRATQKVWMQARLDVFQKSLGYGALTLFDVKGKPYLNAGDLADSLRDYGPLLVKQAIKAGSPVTG